MTSVKTDSNGYIAHKNSLVLAPPEGSVSQNNPMVELIPEELLLLYLEKCST